GRGDTRKSPCGGLGSCNRRGMVARVGLGYFAARFITASAALSAVSVAMRSFSSSFILTLARAAMVALYVASHALWAPLLSSLPAVAPRVASPLARSPAKMSDLAVSSVVLRVSPLSRPHAWHFTA